MQSDLMETTIKGIIESAPHLAALIGVVVIFIRHMEKISDKHTEAFKSLHEDHIDERRESRKVIEGVVKAREENTEALNRLIQTVIDKR